MWNAIATVYANSYDPVIYEGQDLETATICNSGPGNIQVKSWYSNKNNWSGEPDIILELRKGDYRTIQGSLIRVAFQESNRDNNERRDFAAFGWRID